MAPVIRPYIPSAALIRALTRPQTLRCPLARPLPAQFTRGKKSKAAKAREAEQARLATEARKQRHVQMTAEQAAAAAAAEEAIESKGKGKGKKKNKSDVVMTEEGLLAEFYKHLDKVSRGEDMEKYYKPQIVKDGEDPGVEFWEENDQGELIQRHLGTEAEQRRNNETAAMIKESWENPDYDDTELNRRLMDGLMRNPAFAHLAEDLKEIKSRMLTKEEQRKEEEEAEKEAVKEMEPFVEEMNASIRTAIHDSMTELINDPDVGDERKELQAVLDRLPHIQDYEDPEFQALMDRATEKVNNNPRLQAKIAAANENQSPEEVDEVREFEKELGLMKSEKDEHEDPEETEEISDKELNDMMLEMREVLNTIKLEGNLDGELEKILANTKGPDMTQPEDDEGVNFDADTDPEELAASILRLAERKFKAKQIEDAEEEHLPPALAAKVDKLMSDPRLLQKLSYIQKLIAQYEPTYDPNDLTQIEAELAPDPYELEDERTATLEQRMAAARSDPAHAAALGNLRVKLPPPYNISPTLKSFNQVIEFAYVGANDDVRRVLWRSYQRARTLPNFLQNLSDDAWDILYYSQAVTWTGNQNRTDHLKMLLSDLATVGRTGPPTHPSDLGQHQEAARLEAAQKQQRAEAERQELEHAEA